MTGEMIVQIAMSCGVIPALFVWLLFDTRKEHKEQIVKAEEREKQLMQHIEKSDETQRKICETLNSMDKTMTCLQHDIEALKRERD